MGMISLYNTDGQQVSYFVERDYYVFRLPGLPLLTINSVYVDTFLGMLEMASLHKNHGIKQEGNQIRTTHVDRE